MRHFNQTLTPFEGHLAYYVVIYIILFFGQMKELQVQDHIQKNGKCNFLGCIRVIIYSNSCVFDYLH